MTNRMELTGIVAKGPIRKQSPAGIAHCYFVLEHRSIQQEAGLSRQVYCKVAVVISGAESEKHTKHLMLGSNITAGGFLAYQRSQNGASKLVLHADKITYI